MNLTVAHHIPGRIRWRSAFRFTDAFAVTLADRLQSVAGVEGVRVSPRSGSILVIYSSAAALDAAASLLASIRTRPVAAGSLPTAFQIREQRRRAAASDYDWWPLERYVFVRPLLPFLWNAIHTVVHAVPFFIRGALSLVRGRLNVEVLDASAVGISLLMRDFRTAGLIVLLLGLGDMLERVTKKKSLDSLAGELSVRVDRVWVRGADGGLVQKSIRELAPGEAIVVRAGTAIPVDAAVVSGEAFVNQAALTGEPLPVRKAAGGAVFAGTVVEEGEIDIRPTGTQEDSRLNQIARFVDESERRKSGLEARMSHLADAIVPFNFLLAGLVFFFTRSLARTASVLLVDYSCALRLSTPLSVLTAMKEGVRANILIKGGRALEALAEADTVVFDKTGTLTNAAPKLTDVVPHGGWDRDDLLKVAACLEEHFPHPVSRSIVLAARDKGLDHAIEEHDAEVVYVAAHGIRSRVKGKEVVLGSRHFVEEDEGVDISAMDAEISRLAAQGKSILYMAQGGELIGIFGIEDPPKENARAVIEELRSMGIRRIVMLTGDDPRTATSIAARLGVDEFRAQMLPEGKARAVEELRAGGRRVIMVGDGINDTPGLSSADVGVSMRDSTDIAQQVADVVLASNNLEDLPRAIRLSRATLGRVRFNFAASVGLNTGFLAGGLMNMIPPAMNAVLHNGTTMAVCLNAIRGGYIDSGTEP